MKKEMSKPAQQAEEKVEKQRRGEGKIKNKAENNVENNVENKIETKANVVGENVGKSRTQLAVVLVRGLIDLSAHIKKTLGLLKLGRKNHCVVIANNPVNLGMLGKVKDYVTWGEISEDTFNELIRKRGDEYKGRAGDSKGKYQYKTIISAGRKYKTIFRLNPPKKGFGRKGIKIGFRAGGALGYRGEKINDLIMRML